MTFRNNNRILRDKKMYTVSKTLQCGFLSCLKLSTGSGTRFFQLACKVKKRRRKNFHLRPQLLFCAHTSYNIYIWWHSRVHTPLRVMNAWLQITPLSAEECSSRKTWALHIHDGKACVEPNFRKGYGSHGKTSFFFGPGRIRKTRESLSFLVPADLPSLHYVAFRNNYPR